MPHYIIKHTLPDGEDRYLCWSTIVDAPITYGVTRDELRGFWFARWGVAGALDFDRRVAAGGDPETLEYIWSVNRAGADETRISVAQIVDFYIVRRGEGERPVGESWKDIHSE